MMYDNERNSPMTHRHITTGRRSLIAVLLLGVLASALPVQAATLDTTADAVLGQASFTTSGLALAPRRSIPALVWRSSSVAAESLLSMEPTIGC